MPPVQYEKIGAVGVMTLNRPERGNAIDVALADAFFATVLDCDADPEVRGLVITGAGRMFCAGGDVAAFTEAGDALPALTRRLTGPLHAGLARLARLEKAVVTAVNGAAAGAGYGLALCGDVVLAGRSARFVAAYGALGLTPDAGLTWRLPRLVGLRQAQRILVENVRIEAEEAEKIGLISRVVDDERLREEAISIAQKLGQGSTKALARTRTLLSQSYGADFEHQLENEAQAISQSATSVPIK